MLIAEAAVSVDVAMERFENCCMRDAAELAVRIIRDPSYPLTESGLGENLHLNIKVSLSTLNVNECTE
jgi:hypothetical protein